MTHFPNKIYIAGAVGSGKTTLATFIKENHQHPIYSIDDIVWERTHFGLDTRRKTRERDQLLLSTTQQTRWVIEGSQCSWTFPCIEHADVCILLDLPFELRVQQLNKRYLNQLKGTEKSSYVPTLSLLKKMFQWNLNFDTTDRDIFLKAFSVYPEKLIHIHSFEELELFKDKWRSVAKP